MDEVLRHTLRGNNIGEVLELSVAAARAFFTERPVLATLGALDDVGLGYLTLGRTLNTLSGGERQRLELANELGAKSRLYVLDEPTRGLHSSDMGPGAGREGGRVVFEGRSRDLAGEKASVTGRYLARSIS